MSNASSCSPLSFWTRKVIYREELSQLHCNHRVSSVEMPVPNRIFFLHSCVPVWHFLLPAQCFANSMFIKDKCRSVSLLVYLEKTLVTACFFSLLEKAETSEGLRGVKAIFVQGTHTAPLDLYIKWNILLQNILWTTWWKISVILAGCCHV